MKLRNFLESDSEIITSWVLNEEDLYKWSANILDQWPLKPETLLNHYRDGIAENTIFPVVAEDDDGKIFGHCFLRFPFEDKKIGRVGFVIVDPLIRGKGYGKKLLSLVEEYAAKEFGCTKRSLGVYTNNLPALNCYLSMGYIPDGRINDFECKCGKWKVLEMIKDISGQEIFYRKAEKSDLKTIQNFVDNAKSVMINKGILQWDEIYPVESDFSADIEKNELYIGEIEGKAAVCFTLNQWQDEEYFKVQWQNMGNDFIVIHRLCVNPDFQGKKVGLKTCRYIEGLARAKGYSSIKLDTFTQNPIALSLYDKLGYKIKGYADWRKGKFGLMEKVFE